MVLRIGLTGGIGSGKTVVAGIFNVLGIPVFDADTETKNIMETNTGLQKSLLHQFGSEVFMQGRLNRKYLSSLVFNNSDQLAILNAIVHPFAIEAAELWANKQKSPYVIKEAALFFESGSAAGFHYIIGVFSPKHLRIQRVMNRDKINRDEVEKRMQSQIKEEVKMRLCDFVIQNDNHQLLIPQVLKLHEQFLQEAKAT